MQPFAEFRAWTRGASTAEKTQAAVAAGAAVALLVWLLIPVGASSSGAAFGLAGSPTATSPPLGAAASTPSSAGLAPQPGSSAPALSGGVATSTGPGAAGSGSTGQTRTTGGSATSQAAGRPASCAASSAPGVTSSTIKIAVTLAEIVGPAGNATFGLPTVAEQKQKYNAVIASVNASGGVACRKLVPTYYSVNPADENDMHAKCLDIQQAGVFGVIDDGGEYAGADCFAQNHLPFLGENLLFANSASSNYPYLMSTYNLYDNAYRTEIFRLKQRGFFDPSHGFQKLGFMYFSSSGSHQ